MSEHELEKLLGGFAADTLTSEEKQSLYTAALQDQQLFNALADEQALKELLADPDVRRRLLASLEQKSASGTGGSLSWLDWFRRPAGLAFAGGLSAAALAVVLGVRIYQDSLREAAQSIATEEAKPTSPSAPIPPASQPATPQAVEPQAKAKENIAPAIDRQKKDELIDKPAMQERSMPPPSKKERASDVARDSLKQRSRQDEVRRQAEAPVAALSKSAEEAPSPADQKLAASSAQPATAPEPKHIQTPAGGRVAATTTPALSARALFYGEEPGRADTQSMAKEQEQTMKPLAESSPQANRFERKQEGPSQLEQSSGHGRSTQTPRTPLQLCGSRNRWAGARSGCGGGVEEYRAGASRRGSQSRRLSTDLDNGWLLNAATAMARERNRSDLSPNYRWSAAIHSSVDWQRACHPDGSSLSSTVRINHESRNRHGRPALSQPTSRINHRKQSNRLTRTRHLRRQPRSFHNRSGRCRYYPQAVAATAKPRLGPLSRVASPRGHQLFQ